VPAPSSRRVETNRKNHKVRRDQAVPLTRAYVGCGAAIIGISSPIGAAGLTVDRHCGTSSRKEGIQGGLGANGSVPISHSPPNLRSP
jgi:hypothetical protein